MAGLVRPRRYVHTGRLDGTALHYFDAALPEFETIRASAIIS
jgi:hypothetical protein